MEESFLDTFLLSMSSTDNRDIDQITSSLLDVSGPIIDQSSALLDDSNELHSLAYERNHNTAAVDELCDKVEPSPVQNLPLNSTKKLDTSDPSVENLVESGGKVPLTLELENLKKKRPSKRDSLRKIGSGETIPNHHSRTRTRTQRGKMTHHANNTVQPKPKPAGKKKKSAFPSPQPCENGKKNMYIYFHSKINFHLK